MKEFLLRLFTWWHRQTFGTQVWTWRYGEFVGEDEFGNRYYRTKGGKIDPTLRFERRWVTYQGYAEASTVPPTQGSAKAWPWEKPHRPNLTGTPLAWRPSGSVLAEGRRPPATGDYKPWTPEQ